MLFKRYLIVYLVLLVSLFSFSQGTFKFKTGVKQDKIKFKLINSLIVFPVEVNGVELSFLLDTGVSKPIIFSLTDVKDSLLLKNTEKFYLRGLGDGDYVDAYRSKNNIFKVGKTINVNQDLFIIVDQTLNFAPRLGVPIHGIIGSDLFEDFVVEINYSKSFIRLYDRFLFRKKSHRKYSTELLRFHNTKPYIDAEIGINNKIIPVNLLIDTGGSDALWLFEDFDQYIFPDQSYFDDYLGKGLSGNLYGKRSKINTFKLGNFRLSNVNVSFPDSASIATARNLKNRNGSLSGDILKRFNLIFDYNNKKLYFKKSNKFKQPFHYNNSGIILEHDGVRIIEENSKGILIKPFATNNDSPFDKAISSSNNFKYKLVPSFKIAEIVKDSPADRIGLLANDIVLSINGKNAHHLTIQEIMKYFYDKDGEKIKLKIKRNNFEMDFVFYLEDKLKKPR